MSSIENNVAMFARYLDQRVAEHTIHASNVANSETPNYRARVPSFRAVLSRAEGTKVEHRLEMKVNLSREIPREDGNNVNLEKEMSALAENSMRYLSAVKLLTRQMAIASYAVTAGGR